MKNTSYVYRRKREGVREGTDSAEAKPVPEEEVKEMMEQQV